MVAILPPSWIPCNYLPWGFYDLHWHTFRGPVRCYCKQDMGVAPGRAGMLLDLPCRRGNQGQCTFLVDSTILPADSSIPFKIVEVLNKTLAFHTSVNYQRQAPPPFEDIHEDVHADLARISSQSYASDFELHLDLVRSLKRLVDGHCFYMNLCYDCESSLSICTCDG